MIYKASYYLFPSPAILRLVDLSLIKLCQLPKSLFLKISIELCSKAENIEMTSLGGGFSVPQGYTVRELILRSTRGNLMK